MQLTKQIASADTASPRRGLRKLHVGAAIQFACVCIPWGPSHSTLIFSQYLCVESDPTGIGPDGGAVAEHNPEMYVLRGLGLFPYSMWQSLFSLTLI